MQHTVNMTLTIEAASWKDARDIAVGATEHLAETFNDDGSVVAARVEDAQQTMLPFTLADSTFAFACNSHNRVTVAAGCSIEFLRPGQLGDVLTCEGLEQTLSGRHGIYDMKVTNQRGEVVAMFRGKSASIQGTVVPEETR